MPQGAAGHASLAGMQHAVAAAAADADEAPGTRTGALGAARRQSSRTAQAGRAVYVAHPPPAGRWARTQRRRAAASGSPADQAPRCFGYTRTGAEAELGAALQRMCVTGRSYGTTFLLKRCERLRLPETASIMVT